MEITGVKNLSLIKRALLSHISICTSNYMQAKDREEKKNYAPELKEINTMLEAININLKKYNDSGE